jgi:hypothetical protein
MFLFKKYSGASTIFTTIKPALYLIIIGDKLMPIFVFHSSRFQLQKTVFRFEICSLKNNRDIIFLFKKYSGASTIFATNKPT